MGKMDPAATPRLDARTSIEGHTDWVTSLSVNAPLGSEDPDPSQDIYKCSQVISGHSDVVSGCELSFQKDQGIFALSCSCDQSWCLWHLSSKDEKLMQQQKRDCQVNAVCGSPDLRQIFTASNKQVDLWTNLEQLEHTAAFCEKFKDNVSAVVWVPLDKETKIAAVSWDGSIKVWNVSDMKLHWEQKHHRGALHAVAASPDGSLIFAGGDDGMVSIWETATGKHFRDYYAASTIYGLDVNPARYWVALATSNSVRILNLEEESIPPCTFEPEHPLPESIPWALCLKWRQDGERLFAGHSDGTISFYDVVMH
ncbi:unnamed protein product [Effrenium voratum]|nr:unnamed protein product [Effrenium voratum]